MQKGINGVMLDIAKLVDESYRTGDFKLLRKMIKRNAKTNKKNRRALRRRVHGKTYQVLADVDYRSKVE